VKVPWANVNYASKVNSEGFNVKELASRFLFIMLLTGLLISPAAATAIDWKITPSSPNVGDTLKITGTAASGADVRAEVTFIKNLPVSKGRYQLPLKNLQIPDGKDNLFSVRADGVKNLHVGVTKLLTYDLNKDAVNGVATISQGHVPAWSFDILIDGDALKGKSTVQIKIIASQTLTADSKGKFSFSYDTSALPAGDFSIKIGNQVKTVELLPKGQKLPHADFTASPLQGVQPLKVQFTDKSTGSPNKWYWNFGDGKASTARNPAHIYQNAGKYTVSLTVWNAVGSDKITETYLIYVKSKLKPPVADFSASPVVGNDPLKVTFTDKSKELPSKWYWNFGDGKASTAQNPTHIYKNAGKYTVSLTVWNAAGSSKITKTFLIYVKSKLKPPIADFSASPVVGKVPLKVTFTDKSKGVVTWWK
jgi:PKD repeat protein